jgi:hypothetical protein
MATGRQTRTNITIMAAEQKSYDGQKGSRISAADNYITLQDNILNCQKGVECQ